MNNERKVYQNWITGKCSFDPRLTPQNKGKWAKSVTTPIKVKIYNDTKLYILNILQAIKKD